MTEFWDVYDENRKKTGRTHQRGDNLRNGDYHLAVCIWILNSKNEVLITQRHPSKHYGNLWKPTGGCVIVGENSLKGAVREVEEEIGIELNVKEAIMLDEECRDGEFIDTWLFKKDFSLEEITLQTEEVIDAKWVSEEEYGDMSHKGLISPVIKSFYEDYVKYGECPGYNIPKEQMIDSIMNKISYKIICNNQVVGLWKRLRTNIEIIIFIKRWVIQLWKKE